jgi:mono/diheme cytochrome c family protein
MKTFRARLAGVVLAAVLGGSCGHAERGPGGGGAGQTPGWSPDDLEFFLYGSMGAEFIPERVLEALLGAYPDLFPGGTPAAFGFVTEPGKDRPIGFTRRTAAHLGSQPSLGLNCAACHVAVFEPGPGAPPVRVFGAVSTFDPYAFAGAAAVALARTTEPAGMARFLARYRGGEAADAAAVARLVGEDPLGKKGLPPDGYHDIPAAHLESGDVAVLVPALLKLFQNIRRSLYIPDALPPPVPAVPGPGRTDAFSLISATLLGTPAPFDAPVKFGIPWNLEGRTWVHWDGNNSDPYGRNLEATFGLGAPFREGGRTLDFSLLRRQTALSESVRSPRWPWELDRAAAARGERHYRAHCASCHDAPEDRRLHPPSEVGTDPNRARLFDARQAELNNAWLRGLKVDGYAWKPGTYRSTGKYWAADLAGVWARAPYLHNGSVRTMAQLLTPSAARERSWNRGSRRYDRQALGPANEGGFVFDTSVPGNSNAGHDYGTALGEADKRDLLEYMKTR